MGGEAWSTDAAQTDGTDIAGRHKRVFQSVSITCLGHCRSKRLILCVVWVLSSVQSVWATSVDQGVQLLKTHARQFSGSSGGWLKAQVVLTAPMLRDLRCTASAGKGTPLHNHAGR